MASVASMTNKRLATFLFLLFACWRVALGPPSLPPTTDLPSLPPTTDLPSLLPPTIDLPSLLPTTDFPTLPPTIDIDPFDLFSFPTVDFSSFPSDVGIPSHPPIDTPEDSVKLSIPLSTIIAIIVAIIGFLSAISGILKGISIMARRNAGSCAAPENNVSCSDDAAYDATSNTVKTSTQDEITCSENVAYEGIKKNSEETKSTDRDDDAMYDEVKSH